MRKRPGRSPHDNHWLSIAPLVGVAVGYGITVLLGRTAMQATLLGLAVGLGTALVILLRARSRPPPEVDWREAHRHVGEERIVLEVDPDTGVVTWASPAAAKLLGEAENALVGRALAELRPPWAEAQVRALPGAGRAPALPAREHAEPWLGPGQELVYADTVAVTVESDSRSVTILTLYDVTDQRRLEESLARATEDLRQAQAEVAEQRRLAERSETRAGALFQHSLDAVLLVETESRTIAQANPAAVRLTGYPLEQLLARPLSDLDPSEDLRFSRALLGAAGREGGVREEILLRRADGAVVRALASGVTVRSGAWQALQISLRDLEAEHRALGLEENAGRLRREVQELETANRRLEAANRAKAEFLAEMSHEIRTPLNAVVGFSELLEASPDPLSPRQRQFIADIHAAGEHLLGLMADLLDLAQLEAGRMAVQSEPLALGPLVRGVVAVVQGLAEPRRMRLAAEVESEALGAWGDERRVKQVLYNLLSNAVRYSPPGTAVTVAARQEGSWARVSVRDEGPGIPPELQDHIFEDFVRLPVAGNGPTPPGTGLGLAVSRRLVQAMGGKLTLESAPSAGSEFTFLLPLYEPDSQAVPTPR